MPLVIENTKILAVDTSPAMLEVLKNFAGKHGYDFDSHSDPADAAELIERRVEQFETDFRCVVLGWPEGDSAIIAELLSRLSSPDHCDLPLVIICHELNAEIVSLTKKRARTTALLWSSYQKASELIDQLPLVKAPRADKPKVEQQEKKLPVEFNAVEPVGRNAISSRPEKTIRALLVDHAPSVSHTLKDLLSNQSYDVTVAESVDIASELIAGEVFDLIITDYHLHESKGTNRLAEFCNKVDSAGTSAIVIALTAKYTDRVIKESLAAGAVSCLFKNESSELIFARVNALATTLKTGKAGSENTGSNDVLAGSKAVTNASTHSKVRHKAKAKAVSQRQVLSKADDVAAPVVKTVQQKQQSGNAGEHGGATDSLLNATPLVREFHNSLTRTLGLVANDQHEGVRYSVLLLDVQIEAATGDRLSLGDSTPMCDIVEAALGRLYKRPQSMAYLGNGQFALLLASRRLQDALMLTRKVLQLVPKLVRYLNDMTLVSHAAVVQIDGSTQDGEVILQRCRKAVQRTRKDQRDNCALVMPLRKYLTALESDELDSEPDLETATNTRQLAELSD